MKKCKNCGKLMPKAHPNGKFCRTKGLGNCKDAYHNRTNARGIGLQRKLEKERQANKYEAAERDNEEYLNSIHPFSCEGLGQWDD